MTKQRIATSCSNGHSVTIQYDRADIGIEATPPARLYATSPPGLDASGAVVTWGIEQECGECGEVVKASVVPTRI